MKMIKKIALFLIALLPVGLMAQDLKLAHVNSQEIISLMPERADIEKKLNDVSKSNEDYMLKMREEYNKKVKEFVDGQNTMAEPIKNALQTEIQDIDQRINTFKQAAQEDMQKQYESLTAPMYDKLKKAISDVSAEGGYTYVFDISTGAQISYVSPKSNDITPLVKKKLGLSAVKPAATKPAETKSTEVKPADKPAETKSTDKK